jgi:hypothetical protein
MIDQRRGLPITARVACYNRIAREDDILHQFCSRNDLVYDMALHEVGSTPFLKKVQDLWF